jgi:hypothetical protein
LASQILLERFRILKLEFERLRIDSLGSNPKDVRLRVAALAKDQRQVEILCREVEALYINGPAGGGGVTKQIEENIAITSAFIPRSQVEYKTSILGERNDQS